MKRIKNRFYNIRKWLVKMLGGDMSTPDQKIEIRYQNITPVTLCATQVIPPYIDMSREDLMRIVEEEALRRITRQIYKYNLYEARVKKEGCSYKEGVVEVRVVVAPPASGSVCPV